MMNRVQTGTRALCALGLALACCAAAAVSLVQPTRVQLSLPAGAFSMTPYYRTADGLMLVHFQPREPARADLLMDARTGLPADISARALADDFVRLGVEEADAVQAGAAPDLRQLKALGCVPPMRYCTSPADADVVLMSSAPRQGALTLVVADLRPLLGGLEELLAGRRAADRWQVDDATWIWLEWAASQASRRERWLDAIRSIDSVERWQLAHAAFASGPRLGLRPPFQWDERASQRVDLREELERANFRIQVQLFAEAWARTAAPSMLDGLVGALRSSYKLGQTVGMSAYLVDVLTDQPEPQLKRLAVALEDAAGRLREHTLWCYAQWISARPCKAEPPWPARIGDQSGRDPADAAARPAGRPGSLPTQTLRRPDVTVMPGVPGIGIDLGPAGAAGDAQQEMSLVKRFANGLVLLSFDERSGKLRPEGGGATVNGFAFVARSLGAVGSGQFAIQMMPSTRSPVKLALGSYRVRVQLALDYTREDRCNAGFFCRFTDPERYAKTARKELVFRVTPQNRYTDEQAADFKHLQPLVAEGDGRYSSELKDARLAILSARFESL